jgi:SOS-response transcriptional repressor LexA/polyhydroxyalkanoate synthesis regulator phasin
MPASSPGPSSAPTFQPARSADELAKRLTDLERQVKDNAAQVSRHLSKLEVSIQSLLEQTGKRLAGLEGSSGSVMRRLDELTKLEEQNKNNSTRLSQHAGKLGVAIQGLEEQTNNDLRQVSRQLGELENQVREIGQHVDKRAGSLDAQLAELEKQAKSNTGQIAEQLVGQLESQISGLDTLSEKHVKSLADRLDHLENRAGSKLEGLVHQLYQLDTRLREGQGGEQYDLLIHRLAGLEKQAKDDSAQVSQQLLKLEAHIANISSQVNKQMELLATQSVHQTQPKHGWRSTPHRFSVKTIPVYDPIAAGKPRPVAEDVIGYIETEQLEIDGRPMDPVPLKGTEITLTQEYDYAAMQVVGDSMNEADILPGDYVILRRPNRVEWQPEHRDIVAVVFRDQEPEATLKRILIERDRVTLRPESSNPAHEPRTVSRSALFGAEASAAIVWIAVAVLKLAHQE